MLFNPICQSVGKASVDWIERSIPTETSGKVTRCSLEIPRAEVPKSVVVFAPDYAAFALAYKDGTNYSASSTADKVFVVDVREDAIVFRFEMMLGPEKIVMRYLIV